MKKSDLKTGMVVELRNGTKSMVLLDTPCGDVFVNDGDWCNADSCNSGLKCFPSRCRELDVIRVYSAESAYQMKFGRWGEMKMIWERKEPKKMTLAEIEAALGYPVEVIEEVLQ